MTITHTHFPFPTLHVASQQFFLPCLIITKSSAAYIIWCLIKELFKFLVSNLIM